MGRLTHRTQSGWTYFVTTKCAQGISTFQVKENADILIAKLLEYRDKEHYLLHEFVVMPNHLHLILTPSQTTSLEKAIQFIKGGSSHAIHTVRGTRNQIWQSGFHESRVRDLIDYKKKADYIRFNPVAAKLVEKPEDWSFGSASGSFRLDSIPQGLKPQFLPSAHVGAKAPTPKILSTTTTDSAAKP
jgi:putative transposase